MATMCRAMAHLSQSQVSQNLKATVTGLSLVPGRGARTRFYDIRVTSFPFEESLVRNAIELTGRRIYLQEERILEKCS
jgi:hypothetical protein